MGVMIVDSHPSMRLALNTLIESRLRMPVVCSAATADQAYAALQRLRPSVLVTELQLGDTHGGAALCRRAASLPVRPRVMVFTGSSSPNEVAAALISGADSFVHKSVSIAELVDAIRQTACGRRVWLLDDTARQREVNRECVSPLSPLTEREEQILTLLLRRYTNEEIAQELMLAGQTVKNHVSNILHKVGIRNRRELFRGRSVLSA